MQQQQQQLQVVNQVVSIAEMEVYTCGSLAVLTLRKVLQTGRYRPADLKHAAQVRNCHVVDHPSNDIRARGIVNGIASCMGMHL